MSSVGAIVAQLKSCSSVWEVRRIHEQVGEWSSKDMFVGSTLVAVYAKCGSVVEACRVFEKMQSRTVVSWNCIIKGCADNGHGDLALRFFTRMQSSRSCTPNFVTYLAALAACVDLAEKENGTRVGDKVVKARTLDIARRLHGAAAAGNGELHIFVANSLINVYSKCGSVEEARKIFDCMARRSIVSWTAMIQGYADCDEGDMALQLYDRIPCAPNSVTFLAALKACVKLAEKDPANQPFVLQKGSWIHWQISDSTRGEVDAVLGSALVEMYAKCGCMEESRRVFDRISKKDIVSWTTIIVGYVQGGQGEMALDLFARMLEDGVTPDAVTFTAALNACGKLKNPGLRAHDGFAWQEPEDGEARGLSEGKHIHAFAARALNGQLTVENATVDMYVKCGSLVGAQLVFDGMQKPDLISWNCLISGYGGCSEGAERGLELYGNLQQEGWEPDAVTYLAVLKSCVTLSDRQKDRCLNRGRHIYNEIVKRNAMDVYVVSMVMELFARCGSMEESRMVFENVAQKDLVCWNTVLSAYTRNGDEEMSLKLYERMRRQGFGPNAITYLAVIEACAGLCVTEKGNLVEGKMIKTQCLEKAKAIHSDVQDSGLAKHVLVASGLVNLYSKCGSMLEAEKLFESMPRRSVVSWTALIQGYADCGELKLALEHYSRMKGEGECRADGLTFAALLRACGRDGDLEAGRNIEEEIRSLGLESEPVVGNSLVDFYGKCGCMLEAEERFEAVSAKTLVTWNALIDGYSRWGNAEKALQVFERMKKEEAEPNEITLLCLLTACSHAGLVEEGKNLFEWMVKQQHGLRLEAGVKHYGVMVDLLGRANRLEEALKLAEETPTRNMKMWMALLDASSKLKNEGVARRCFDLVVQAGDKEDVAAAYVLMANACAA